MSYQETIAVIAVYIGLFGTLFMLAHIMLFAITGLTNKTFNIISFASLIFLFILYFAEVQAYLPSYLK